MKVLLTGATGYIGTAVAERLTAAGHAVTGLARSPHSADLLRARGLRVAVGDLADPAATHAAAAGMDAVVHTAAFGGRPEDDVAAAAAALHMLLDLALDPGSSVTRLVTTSGVGVYGDTGEKVLDETAPLALPPPLAALADAETRVHATANRTPNRTPDGTANGTGDGTADGTGDGAVADGPLVTTVRPAIVHGRGGSLPVLRLLAGLRERGRGGYVTPNPAASAVSAVHVDDLADLYLAVLTADQPAALYLAAAETVPSTEVMAAAAAAAGVDPRLEPMTGDEAESAFGFIGHYLSGAMRINSELARSDLRWRPWRPGIVADLTAGSYRPGMHVGG